MAHRIVVTRLAEDDLEAIGDYIARDNPPAAYALFAQIRDRIAGLTGHPERHQLRPQFGRACSVLVVGAYVVVYRATADTVYVVRVFQGAHDSRRHL